MKLFIWFRSKFYDARYEYIQLNFGILNTDISNTMDKSK